MPQAPPRSLWHALCGSGSLSGRVLSGSGATVSLDALSLGSSLRGRLEDLAGQSVLIATADQLTAALALIELDGIARRIILYPADLPLQHLSYVVSAASVDAIVTDRADLSSAAPAAPLFVPCSSELLPAACERSVRHQTEWILLTSGTTGQPKMVVHTLFSLTAAIRESALAGGFVWSTFYDIRRYGGLQIFLRDLLTGGSLVLSCAHEPASDFLARAGARGVTHISGTPTHWRQALMCPSAAGFAPRYIRLSGEIADQAILDNLRSFYPNATIAHAFASTEAGVAFDVRDGLAGFPASLIGRSGADVEMKIVDGSLRIRSSGNATRYLGSQEQSLRDTGGFVDTGDMVEPRGDRYYFVGRRDGVINVGGLKVHPEEVESVINRHPRVRMSLVRARKSPLTGSLVVADVVLNREATPAAEPAAEKKEELEPQILSLCRRALPRHKVPAAIRFVGELAVSSTGKMARPYA
jgi:acyl-CoA synthetase (AMP-forming)/AMP-acid ligase II